MLSMWVLKPFFPCHDDAACCTGFINSLVKICAVPSGDSFTDGFRRSLAVEDAENFFLEMREIEVRKEPPAVRAFPRLCDRDHVREGIGCLNAFIDTVRILLLCLCGASKACACGCLHVESDLLSTSGLQLPEIIGGNGPCSQRACRCLTEFERGGEDRVGAFYRKFIFIRHSHASYVHQFTECIARSCLHSLVPFFR